MIQGFTVDENRLKQLGDVVRLMKRTQDSLDSKQGLSVIGSFSSTLELLDAYDHQNMKRPKGSEAVYHLTYEECHRAT